MGAPFHPRGIWYVGGGETRIPGKKGSSGGVSLSEGFHEVDLEGGLLYWGTRKMRFLGDMQNALETGLPLHRDPVREPGRGSFAGTFERKKIYLGSFLGPGGH